MLVLRQETWPYNPFTYPLANGFVLEEDRIRMDHVLEQAWRIKRNAWVDTQNYKEHMPTLNSYQLDGGRKETIFPSSQYGMCFWDSGVQLNMMMDAHVIKSKW